jgi:hypothetical protein
MIRLLFCANPLSEQRDGVLLSADRRVPPSALVRPELLVELPALGRIREDSRSERSIFVCDSNPLD